jgi:type I restriction enzyme R subunit
LSIDPFTGFGTPAEIIRMFGSREKYIEAIKDLEKQLYQFA